MRLLAIALLAATLVACSSPDATTATATRDDPNRCASCHMAEYAATTHPMHPGQKPTTCGVCHAMTSWHPSRVEHPFFALTEGHAKPACFDCHKGTPPTFRGLGKECVGCHRADFDRATFPGHAKFPVTCEECHTRSAWKPSTWKTLPEPEPPGSAAPTHETPAPAKPGAPKPKPKPKPAPSVAPAPSGPDVITRPSQRRR
jgi:hypothetical protein